MVERTSPRVDRNGVGLDMRFDEKARENAEAAELLLTAPEMPLPNTAASRAYYAAYLAVADRAQLEHVAFDSSQADYYRHDTLPDQAVRWGILDEDSGDDLRWLRDLRVKADYWEDQVSLEEASEASEAADKIVGRLCPEVQSDDI